MCGIVGIATKMHNGFTIGEADMFREMLYYDALRGWDSTGVFGVDKYANVQIHKEASQAGEFIFTEEFKKFKEGITRAGLFAVGHNRAATRGSVEDKNAHPFWIDDKIVLVQNGTWRGDHKHVKDTEVDTEALAHIIADNEDIETALSKINAAYALCWFNTATKSLHLVRNYERPLWTAETVSGTMVWASEPGFIQLASSRNSVTLKDKPSQLEPHELVTFEIKGNNWEKTIKKVNPFRSSQAARQYIWPEDDDDDCDSFKQIQQQQRPSTNVVSLPVSQRSNHRHSFGTPAPASMIANHFADEAYRYVSDCTIDDPQLAARCQASWRQAILDGKDCVVELSDYLAGNQHKDCSVWHVYGRAIVGEGHDAEHAIVHWFLYNKTEQEIMDYVSQGFYSFKPANTLKSEFREKQVSIVTVLPHINTITLIETQPMTMQ